jgi:hypothetical protein
VTTAHDVPISEARASRITKENIMNTISLRQPRTLSPHTLSLASMLVAAGAVVISVAAISTDDVGVTTRLGAATPPAAAVVATVAEIPCDHPVGPSVGRC